MPRAEALTALLLLKTQLLLILQVLMQMEQAAVSSRVYVICSMVQIRNLIPQTSQRSPRQRQVALPLTNAPWHMLQKWNRRGQRHLLAALDLPVLVLITQAQVPLIPLGLVLALQMVQAAVLTQAQGICSMVLILNLRLQRSRRTLPQRPVVQPLMIAPWHMLQRSNRKRQRLLPAVVGPPVAVLHLQAVLHLLPVAESKAQVCCFLYRRLSVM